MNKQFNHRLSLGFAFMAILIEFTDMHKINNLFEFIFATIIATVIYYGIARVAIKVIESLFDIN